MSRIASAGTAALLLCIGLPAHAECQADLASIDERLAAMEISEEARVEVEGLRAAGGASCSAADEATARLFLDPAKFLLGLIAVMAEGE